MDTAAQVMEMVFLHILGGMGLFFTGVGVLWFVTVYKQKRE
jgi:hypothetical protein